MAEISIILNGEVRQVRSDTTLDSLIEYFSLPRQRVAIEYNNSVARRIDWPKIIVRESDRIEVVHFVGGG